MSIPITNITDSWVNQEKPDKNYSDTARLKLATGTGVNKIAYLYFGKVWEPGMTIVSARLYLHNAKLWSGTITLSVRRLSDRKGMSKLKYTNRPAPVGAAATVVKSNAPADTLWDVDITSIIQTVVNGADWYGLEITANGATGKNLHSAQSPDVEFRPMVEITFTEAPDQPDDLNPRNGNSISVSHPTLSANFVDLGGDTTMGGLQVQIDALNDFETAPDFDSGWVDTDTPIYSLVGTSYAGLANGGSAWWRIRVRDGAGVESPWSEPVRMRRNNYGVLTISNPPAAPNNFVTESTPPIFYTFTGQTQSSHRALIVNPENPSEVYWDSGRLTEPDLSFTVPADVIKKKLTNYRLIIRVWDDVERQQEGDRPVYVEATRDFTLQFRNTTAPAANVQILSDYPYPWADVQWTRSTAPDSFTIMRDDEIIATDIDPEDALVSGTTYRFRDVRAPGRVPHKWEVVSVINGVSSDVNPQATAVVKPNFTWLMREDSTDPICILKSGSEPAPVVDASNAALQEVHQPVGGGAPVLLTQFLRKYEGRVEGVLSDNVVEGLSAREMRNRYKRFRNRLGEKLVLYMVDETIEIMAYNMVYRSRARSGGVVLYDVAFDFFEV